MPTAYPVLPATIDEEAPKSFGVTVERERLLAALTTIKVGGPADYFATVHTTHQMIKLVRWARTNALPYLIFGGGSNVLVSDAGVRGLVIHNRCREVRIDQAPCCDYPQDPRPYLFAESGTPLAGLARTSVNAGLTGLEWAVSVPGTVGGAVVNNAGAHGGEVKDNLWDTMVLDENDEVRTYSVADMDYGYRHSRLKRGRRIEAGFASVVLNANFRLTPADVQNVRTRADSFLARRRETQPVGPSLGSTFKNPPGDYAGRLIQAAGLRGHRIGAIQVSPTHANFLVNTGVPGQGTASDVTALIQEIQRAVLAQFGVKLETEIQWVGE